MRDGVTATSVRRLTCAVLLATALAAQAVPLRAATEVPLGAGSVARFADVREGIDAVTRRDAYIQALSPFDRQVRLRTDGDPSEADFLSYMAGHVVPWSEAEVARLTPLVSELAQKIAPWKLNLPPLVLLVKTTGREESGAAYCRGPAIVLPQNLVDGGAARLKTILPHELFHVLSSHNPALRDALYATIGFRPANEIALPADLAARKISNPDAPLVAHYITVVHDGRTAHLAPVLFSKAPRYDASRGGSLFSYLTFRLMEIENVEGTWRPVLRDGQPVLLDPTGVDDFHRQIGKNTSYIIHPEEVLADNFIHLLAGRIDLPSQHVVEQMAAALESAANRP